MLSTANPSGLVDAFGRPLANSNFYDAAAYSRLRAPLPYNVADSKKTLTPYTRLQMLSRARYLYANVGFIKGAVDDIALYSVGNGIAARSTIEDTAIRREFDEAWDAWKNTADFYGAFHFDAIQDLASRAIDVDGDPGAIFTEDEEGQARLQMIESHRVGDFGKGGETEDGVLKDSKGRLLGYRVRDDDAGTGYTDIPAGKFALIFDPDRLDERGRHATALKHAIINSQDKLDILRFEKTAVKANSSISLAIKTAAPEVGPGFFSSPETQGQPGDTITLEQLRAGAIPRLGPGEDIWKHDSTRPSTAFAGFLDYLDRDVALGLGVPVQFLHCSDMGGTPQRFVMRKAERKFAKRAMQIARFVRRVRFYWAAKEILRGALPYVEDWYRVRIEYPATASVDIGREAQQNREDLKYGNRTLAQDAGEQGLDWREDIRAQRQSEAEDLIDRAKAIEKKKGIPFELALALMQQGTPNGNPVAPTTEPKTTAQEEDDEKKKQK